MSSIKSWFEGLCWGQKLVILRGKLKNSLRQKWTSATDNVSDVVHRRKHSFTSLTSLHRQSSCLDHRIMFAAKEKRVSMQSVLSDVCEEDSMNLYWVQHIITDESLEVDPDFQKDLPFILCPSAVDPLILMRLLKKCPNVIQLTISTPDLCVETEMHGVWCKMWITHLMQQVKCLTAPNVRIDESQARHLKSLTHLTCSSLTYPAHEMLAKQVKCLRLSQSEN